MSSSNCCFLTHIQVSQKTSKVVWYSHIFKNFPVCCDLQSQRKYQEVIWAGHIHCFQSPAFIDLAVLGSDVCAFKCDVTSFILRRGCSWWTHLATSTHFQFSISSRLSSAGCQRKWLMLSTATSLWAKQKPIEGAEMQRDQVVGSSICLDGTAVEYVEACERQVLCE